MMELTEDVVKCYTPMSYAYEECEAPLVAGFWMLLICKSTFEALVPSVNEKRWPVGFRDVVFGRA